MDRVGASLYKLGICQNVWESISYQLKVHDFLPNMEFDMCTQNTGQRVFPLTIIILSFSLANEADFLG